jgi:mannose-6-phosphate isomerase-like protein (cupin superfamily)
MTETRTLIQKVWGHEEIVVATELYTLKKLHLKKDFQCSTHYHPVKDETFVIDKGHVLINVMGMENVCGPGFTVRLSPGTPHSFRGITDAVIVEVSTEDRPEDSIRIDGEESRYVGPYEP